MNDSNERKPELSQDVDDSYSEIQNKRNQQISEVNPTESFKKPFYKHSSKTTIIVASIMLIITVLLGFQIYRHLNWNESYNKMSAKEYFYRGINCGDVACEIENYSKAIELNPNDSLSYWARYLAYDFDGELKKAAEDKSQAFRAKVYSFKDEIENDLQIYPNNSKLHLFYGTLKEIKFSMFSDQEMIESLTKAIQFEPGNAAAYYFRAKRRLNPPTQPEALADLSKSIELSPKHADSYKDRSMLYERDGFWEKAIADKSKEIELLKDVVSPTYLRDAYFERLELYRKNAEFDKALADSEIIYDITKNLVGEEKIAAGVFSTRGAIYLDKKDYDKALADLNESLKREPRHITGYVFRGKLYYETGDYDKALADLSKAVESTSLPTELLMELYEKRAKIYQTKGQDDLAKNDFEKIKQLKNK